MTDLITSKFGAYTPARDVVEGIDLSGRTAVVTGASSGIGVETARALAEAGAEVVLAVRNVEAGEATAADIRAKAPGARVSVQRVDLSSLKSARAFGEAWGGDRRLDILVNNAGVMACPLAYTEDGLEMQVGTCHFGHFALTSGLLPALERAAQASASRRAWCRSPRSATATGRWCSRTSTTAGVTTRSGRPTGRPRAPTACSPSA